MDRNRSFIYFLKFRYPKNKFPVFENPDGISKKFTKSKKKKKKKKLKKKYFFFVSPPMYFSFGQNFGGAIALRFFLS